MHKRYGEPDGAGRTVLDGLTHAFAAGRLSAVVGRSGSGKTTLLHLLAGLELPDAGEVLVLGQPLPWLDRAALARRRRSDVALVTQEPGLVPFLDPVENIALALSLRGTGNGGHERARAALAAVGLERRLHERVGRLSAGERQRVAMRAHSPPRLRSSSRTSRRRASTRSMPATSRACSWTRRANRERRSSARPATGCWSSRPMTCSRWTEAVPGSRCEAGRCQAP